LVRRAQPGEVAVINHEDLDRVAADGLVAAGVTAVVNAAKSSSGRYPNLGPLVLSQSGVPLIDGVGPLVMNKVREGDAVRVDGDRVYVRDHLAAVGTRQTQSSIVAAMEDARQSLAGQFESFAENTIDYIQRERDLLFGGAGLPDIDHDLAHRHVLVVVRGTSYKQDLAALRPYISEVHPVLIGVDGGADALIDAGYTPDLIVGDMDSASEKALALATPAGGRGWRRKGPTEIILHAYASGDASGHAPGRARLDALGVPYKIVEATGTSEDVAYLLAHDKRADLIVAVGSHGNLREFLDKGRMGMASSFLVRLRVGETLMDAKGVSRLYPGRIRARDTALLVGSAVFAMAVTVLVSPSLRLYLGQVVHNAEIWFRGLF
jgi:uncharacterized membrane-anchored protein